MKNEKVVVKKIELELYFDSDFVPPDKFDEPLPKNHWNSKCAVCPFYGFEDDTGFRWCEFDFGTTNAEEECPIKKFFE